MHIVVNRTGLGFRPKFDKNFWLDSDAKRSLQKTIFFQFQVAGVSIQLIDHLSILPKIDEFAFSLTVQSCTAQCALCNTLCVNLLGWVLCYLLYTYLILYI